MQCRIFLAAEPITAPVFIIVPYLNVLNAREEIFLVRCLVV